MKLFENPHYDKHEQVVFGYDEDSGLRAIIAVHNTNLGPSLGGCRMYPYASEDAALADVLRLSRGMTYKSALANLPLGGGKSVIIGDPRTEKRPDRLAAMGRFVNRLGGNYIVAKDMGICVGDLQQMSRHTRHISGACQTLDAAGKPRDGDPSPSTALGVYCGIQASVAQSFGARRGLAGLRVAIQGLGSVGWGLAERLHAAGAELFVSDIDAQALERARTQLGATITGLDEILTLDVDVLAPCALGAVIDETSVEAIRAGIVAGAANNQLASPRQARRLHERGILYAPDYVINAGGIIDAWYMHSGKDLRDLQPHVEGIAETLHAIYREARARDLPTTIIADRLAEERFQREQRMVS